MIKRSSLPLALLLLLSITCFAQDGVSTKVDDYIRGEIKSQQIPGLALAVIKDGHAHISRYVDDKMTVILFANQIRANQTKLAHGVAAIINPELASKN